MNTSSSLIRCGVDLRYEFHACSRTACRGALSEEDDVEVRAGAEVAGLLEGGIDKEGGARDEVDEVENGVGAADWRLGAIEGDGRPTELLTIEKETCKEYGDFWVVNFEWAMVDGC